MELDSIHSGATGWRVDRSKVNVGDGVGDKNVGVDLEADFKRKGEEGGSRRLRWRLNLREVQ